MIAVVQSVSTPSCLDVINANQLRQKIGNVVDSGVNVILIDLENVISIDTYGLFVFLSIIKNLQKAGIKLYLCSVNDCVRMVFELTQLDGIIEAFANQDEFNKIFPQVKISQKLTENTVKKSEEFCHLKVS
ncbi:MAG: hypothetical protein NVS2B14_18700 [Chamaesiphon sp.]